jgi:tellurite resistance protein TerC
MLVAASSFVNLDIQPWMWIGLAALITVMLAIDLMRHRDDHETTPKEALAETAVWIACGLAFAGLIAWQFGGAAFSEYLSGYLIEKSLSVDNVFVWSIVFSSLAIPLKYQHRVLFWGIFGALAMRFVFIFVGTALIDRFWWLLLIFGLFLVYTGVKIVRHRNDEENEVKTTGLGLLRRFMPVTDTIENHNFFTRMNGRRAATPLLAALVVVEMTDLLFAVDSVPAVLAVSKEPFIVFSANAFAILGLRAMYFLLANARERFHYLSHALGGILVLVGIKMTASHWVHVDTYVSLGLILAILVVAVVASQRKTKALEASQDGRLSDTAAELRGDR